MPGNVYALLVGIDRYEPPVPALQGCVNDITAVAEVLGQRVPQERFHDLMLTDTDASRDAVIEAFRSHLGRAGEGDVAVFYYSGHGSQQAAPPEMWDFEPDHLNETLVLADSRRPGKWDLADKELAMLVSEVAGTGARVVVVLDCCHSGGGTRKPPTEDVTKRRAPTDHRARPVEDFLPGTMQGAGEDAVPTRGARSGWSMPRAEHVLLAACRSDETAKELAVDGRKRGAFSVALETALRTSGALPSYRALHRFVASGVRNLVDAQNPQLEAAAADLDVPFLDGTMTPLPPHFVLTYDHAVGWVVDGGLVHGIPKAVGEESSHLAVYPDDASLDRRRIDEAVAEATTTRVELARSLVSVTPEPDRGRTYRAVLTSLAMPPVRVRLAGEAGGVERLRETIAARAQSGDELVREAASEEDAVLQVLASTEGYAVHRLGTASPLTSRIVGEDAPARALRTLEHMASWWRLAELRNPVTALAPDAVAVEVSVGGRPASGGDELRLHYARPDGVDGAEVAPRFTVRLTNRDSRTLWCGLLDLTEPFGVFADAFEAGSVRLAAGESTAVELHGEIGDDLFAAGVHELTDIIKVVVSTTEFDPRSAELEELDVEAVRGDDRESGLGTTRGAPTSTLDRLMRRAVTRRLRPRPSGMEQLADWRTQDVLVTVVRPARDVAIGGSAGPVRVAEGLEVTAPPGVVGTVRVATAPEATRDLTAPAVPALLADLAEVVAPFPLVGTRAGSDALDTLVLTVEGHDEVTAEQPLLVRVDQRLGEDEHVLAYAHDGELYLPLGYARRDGDATEIVIERLSDPVADARSLVGAVRILFRKVVGARVGLPYDYPLLRRVVVDAEGRVEHDTDLDAIRAAVRGATSVLLYVHGILGDTEGMTRSSRFTRLRPPPSLVGERYDVTLAFDYENIHTTIAENAALLRDRLAAVGLGPDDGVRLDVVAHSMGGLVSRWFIELGGGAEVVDRLVTLGTPNDGSPWPNVQKWATTALTFGLNQMTAVAWPAAVLTALLQGVERVDNALDEMQPGSALLAQLAGGPDPHVPYVVVIGSDALLPEVAVRDNLVSRVLAKLSPKKVVGVLVDAAFFGRPNDIAVSVTSGRAVPTDRTPAPVFHEVPSDHLTYFTTAASLSALADALTVQEP